MNALKSLLSAAALLVAGFSSMPVLAQTDQAAASADEALEEITVVGIRSSLDSAAAIKRSADQMVDAITAEDIGLFSDNNIAEAVQRIPGVQLERDAGEGFRISIRGLGPRFVRTTVNGRTALSAAGGEDGSSEDSRGFTLNMIPSEVITRVTVEKSVQARNLEGGLGGTLDLQTNRPIAFADRKKEDFYISTAVRGGYNDLVGNNAYRGSLFLNKKVSDNFGVFVGAVIDDTDRADHAIETEALRVRPIHTSGSNTRFDIDRLEPGTLLNGVPLTQEDIDAWDAATRNVGPNGEHAGITMFNAARNSMRDFDRERQTLTTGMQWQSGNFDVNFDWTYGNEGNNQYLRRFAMSPPQTSRRAERNVTSLTIDFGDQDYSRTNPTIGTMTAFEFEGAPGHNRVNTENRQIYRDQEINVGGLNVEWSNDDWTIVGDIGYALMEMDRYDNQLGTFWNADDDDGDLRFEDMNGSFTTLGPGGYPVAYFEGVCLDDSCGPGTITPFDPTDPEQFYFRRAWRTLTSEEADDISARLDFSRILPSVDEGNLRSIIDEIQFGIAWNERNGTRTKGRAREDDLRFDGAQGDDYVPDVTAEETVIDSSFETYLVQDYLPDIPGAVHEMVFLSHEDPKWQTQWAIPKSELHGRYLQHDQGFNITEEVTAAYIQFPFSGDNVRYPFRGNIGVRYVHTDQTGLAYEESRTLSEDGLSLISEIFPRMTNRTYDDWLPSFNVAIDMSDEVVLRVAASKSLTRPDPLDMTSYVDLDAFEYDDEEGSGSGGNPLLEPYGSANVDLSLEWYPEFGGSYALGLFRKDLDGWIARGRSDEVFLAWVEVDADEDDSFDPEDGVDYYDYREEVYSIRRHVNTEGGLIKGAEFAFHLPFDSFSDSFLSYFGVNGSVTYVDAEMDAVVPENNLPISLRGTSEWSGNLVAYFEMEKFSARVAYNYRDDFLFQEAEDPDRHAEWTKGSEIIDLNLNYRPMDNLLVRLSADNLTGKTRVRYWETAGTNRFSDDRDNGQYYQLEVRWHTE